MTHLWVRAEPRPGEARVGLMPDGAAQLIAQGMTVTVEDSAQRAVRTQAYADVGAQIAPEGSWPSAPKNALIFGLKELP
ncbi:MAG: saccharopine dehydrogenase, partial [Pseudomonadota bacterium]